MTKTHAVPIAAFVMFLLSPAVLPAVSAAEADSYFNGGGQSDMRGLVSGLRSGETELPASPAPEPAKPARAPAGESTALKGFLSRVEGGFYVSSNLYFNLEGESYLIENFSGLHKFSLKAKDLYVNIKDEGDFRLGKVDLEPAALKEGERAAFELAPALTSSMVFYDWKLPKISYVFVADITGFGWVRQVSERTKKIISLKTPEGLEFCYYRNITGRVNGALYAASENTGCR